MSYYGQERPWKRLLAIALIAAAIVVLTIKTMQPRQFTVKWDSGTVERGDMATLWVNVRNTGRETVDAVIVRVVPVSPYLQVYSEQNAESDVFIIPKLAAGAEALAKFGIHVSKDAYAGDHAVRVIVAFPEKSYVTETKIRVV